MKNSNQILKLLFFILLTLLTTASTTNTVFAGDYLRTYSYNTIGNITNKSDQGVYTYSETGYANPHAVTDIAGVTYAYDNNGNLTSAGSWVYTWDYRNRLSSAGNGVSTTIFCIFKILPSL